jgi:hypothetical protein
MIHSNVAEVRAECRADPMPARVSAGDRPLYSAGEGLQ